jgi:ATP-dependent Clp protease adapter protein ClpS
MSQVVQEPSGVDAEIGSRWMVVILNNDTNSEDEVVSILVAATNCTVEEACIEMWEAHTLGKASVHFASKDDCTAVAQIIGSIGVGTNVVPEWK